MPLPRDGGHRGPLERALERYGRYVEHRPVDPARGRWPQSPAAALAWAMRDLAGHVAADGEPPRSPLYAIERLNIVTKQMAADAKRREPDGELERRRRRRGRLGRHQRAAARAAFAFRSPAAGWRARAFGAGGATEWTRAAAIDAALAGELPGFEGLHGFLIRASDLLGRPNPHRALPDGRAAGREALDALRHVRDFLTRPGDGSDPDGRPGPDTGEQP